MNPRRAFAAAYFIGMTTGLAAGVMLPWWVSGAPAWVLAWVVHDVMRTHLPHPHEYMVASPQRIAMAWSRDRIVRAAVVGAFVGACSGAAAAGLPGIYAWTGLASRPLDGHLCGALACALVGADAWVRGDAPSRVSPGLRGTVAYLAFAAFVAAPALVEVMAR